MQKTASKHDTGALEELAEYHQWVIWYYSGQQKKPIDPGSGGFASTADPDTWSDYETAIQSLSESDEYEGLGFVFSKDDSFTGIDLDACVEDGEVAQWADEIVKALDSYTEVSPSGTGLKVWVKASKPGTKCKRGNVEIYDQKHYFTFTGWHFYGDRIEERQDALNDLYGSIFPHETKEEINTGVADGGFAGDDATLLDKARKANGTGELFSRLYDRGVWWGRFPSQSEADERLCGMLAWWTGGDEERMHRLFRGSALAQTLDRKSNPGDYLDRTVAKAIANNVGAYNPEYKTQAKADVRSLLEGCIEHVVSGTWAGRSGPTDRNVYTALINTCVLYGRVVKGGVEVSAGLRDLALASGTGRRGTVSDALKRLENKRNLIRKIADSAPGTAARYLVLTQNRTINKRVNKYGTPLRQLSRIRNPSRYYETIGKRSAHILDYIYSLGSVATLEEIAEHIGARKYDLKNRYINKLLEHEQGLLEEADGGYVAPSDLEERLERLLEDSGMAHAERLQAKQYELDREVWRNGDGHEPRAKELELKKELDAMRAERRAQTCVVIPDLPMAEEAAA